MKIIKPLRLSVLNRPFRWQGKNYLGISVIALTDMGENPQLRPEMELWQLAANELKSSGGVIDMAMPKGCAEFLATGHVFANHQENKQAVIARIDIGSVSKSVIAFGDRYWSGSRMTSPKAFNTIPLDWTHAYGGENYEENPHGIGFRPENYQGEKLHRLPNIEPLTGRLCSPRQKQEPASFGPLDFTWPRRFNRMGKKYDANWMQNDFPGFARDLDWRVFNAASPDQWWADRQSLPDEAVWRIWNMHPEKPLQEGKLPPWQARCFIDRQRGEEELFEEIPLRATTVWFFPHLEQMILIWQGYTRINEDDAADVLNLMPALEKNGASRSLNHYRKVLTQRIDKEKGAFFSFREKDLIPDTLIGPWIDNQVEEVPSPMRDNLRNREKVLREQHRERLEQSGLDVADLFEGLEQPETPKLDNLPEYMDKMERQLQTMQAEAEKRKYEMEEKYPYSNEHLPRGPESLHRMNEMFYHSNTAMSDKQRQQSSDALHQLYLSAVAQQPPAIRLTGDLALIIRQRAERTLAQGGDFSGMDLTGADFSGMNLRGANFTRALLECANFRDSILDGAIFQQAMLARAEFENTSAQTCDFTEACLSFARCQRSDFSGSVLHETQIQNAFFDACIFDNVRCSGLLIRETGFNSCRFHNAMLDGCIFMDLTLTQPDFHRAGLHKCSFMQLTLSAAGFNGAKIDSCSFIKTCADHADFTDSTIIATAITAESSILNGNFSHATLLQCNFRQAPLTGGCFIQAKLENCDFSEADCRRTNFTRANLAGSMFVRTNFCDAVLMDANLMASLLSKSQLVRANFSGANLFRADLSQAFISDDTQLDGAWIKRLKTLPRRDREII
ncbi:DUF2169 family type VI secretion system accessory protein [Phytobacter massiliensis]|uniref:DUF2169 family type VI secretion system accessory protein n=1 Tax=Phytobacter massiliensis TaxID=1485952 RepID=UPI000301ABB6|nr:DUF2169 domain-containing protein [Phytobacter massiliensis]